MEELIEEYKTLGLNDSEAFIAITQGIPPDVIKKFRVSAIQFHKSMQEVMQTIMNVFQNNKEFLKMVEDMREKEVEQISLKKRSKKGKKIKTWQKNKFFQ